MSEKVKLFAVVEFDEVINGKKVVELVPISWLTDNDSQCFWPPKSEEHQVQKWVEQECEPTAGWAEYPVQVICKARDYEQGIRRLEKSYKKREVDTSESELQNKKDDQPMMLNSSSIAAVLANSRRRLGSQTNLCKEATDLAFTGNDLFNTDSSSNNGDDKETTPESEGKKAGTASDLTGVENKELEGVVDHRTLARYLQGVIEREFKSWRQSMNFTMHNRFQQMLKVMQYPTDEPEKKKAWMEIGEDLPFDELEKFIDFDDSLKKDEKKKAGLNDIFKMVTAGQTDCEDDVHEIMIKLIKKNVQLEYSGCGKKVKGVGKKSFKDTECFKEMEKFLKTKYCDTNQKLSVVTLVSRFLSGAKDREGGRAQRGKDN